MKKPFGYLCLLCSIVVFSGCGEKRIAPPPLAQESPVGQPAIISETATSSEMVVPNVATTTTPTTTTPLVEQATTTPPQKTPPPKNALPSSVQKLAYDNFDNMNKIIQSTEWIHSTEDPAGWIKAIYQDGLTVHQFTAPSLDIEKKSSYLRGISKQYHSGHPNCFAVQASFMKKLQTTHPQGITNYEDRAVRDEVMGLLKDGALQDGLLSFFGNQETAQMFTNTLIAQSEKGTVLPLHVIQVCKTQQEYLVNTISSADVLHVTAPTTVVLFRWNVQSGELTAYPPLKISGPNFWYNLIPDFFSDDSLLVTEDYALATYTLNSLNRWQAYKIAPTPQKLALIEDCIGNFLRDRDVSSSKGSFRIITEEGYQYACVPGYTQ